MAKEIDEKSSTLKAGFQKAYDDFEKLTPEQKEDLAKNFFKTQPPKADMKEDPTTPEATKGERK